MLEFVDEPLDHVAELVPFAIMTANVDIATRWDDRLSAGRANLLAQRIAVLFLVGDDVLRCEAFQQDLGAGNVLAFPFGQMQLGRLALAVNRDVDFGAEASAGMSQALGVLPLLYPRMLGGPNDRRVEQQVR
jgi:hypothetical protein